MPVVSCREVGAEGVAQSLDSRVLTSRFRSSQWSSNGRPFASSGVTPPVWNEDLAQLPAGSGEDEVL